MGSITMFAIIEFISKAIAFVSIFVIVFGIFASAIKFFKNQMHREPDGIRQLRAYFSGYLLFGLELLIGADIIKSIAEPTYQKLIILAGIVILRTVLSVFLNRELKELSS